MQLLTNNPKDQSAGKKKGREAGKAKKKRTAPVWLLQERVHRSPSQAYALSMLNSIQAMVFILVLVIIACYVGLTAPKDIVLNDRPGYLLFDIIVYCIFAGELMLRFWATNSSRRFFADWWLA